MSLAQFTLGARLRAQHTRRPVPAAHYSPAIPPTGGIAATITTDAAHLYLTATDGTTTRTGTNRTALDALAAYGIGMTEQRRPLIVATTADLAALTDLAHAHHDHPASPVIAWWDQRADHPGTDAVHIATDTARHRWILGVHPDAERTPDTWAHWLNITTTGPQQLLDLATLTTTGPLLPGLLHASILDTASWTRHQNRTTAGRPWWLPDTRIDAALGLLARSHATEWYESLRLDDPRVALAASHDGSVVPAVVTAHDETVVELIADRPLSRLRVGTKIAGWRGDPINAGTTDCLTGTIDATTIDRDAHLRITITDVPRRAQIAPGDRITLRPARVDPNMQSNARTLAAMGYRRGTNWIAGRGKPTTRRGNVPLDVIAAAAD
ncbi:hypothetical protein [Microbacterium panaciterrae]|uniref:Uncharacterized protein n=1 Tax=Microbacterium panaciterrae TaxID=985759 RepID=A0ABP8PWJ3_9MICO